MQKCTVWLNVSSSQETEAFIVNSNTKKIIDQLVNIGVTAFIYIYEICIFKNLFKGHTEEGKAQI